MNSLESLRHETVKILRSKAAQAKGIKKAELNILADVQELRIELSILQAVSVYLSTYRTDGTFTAYKGTKKRTAKIGRNASPSSVVAEARRLAEWRLL